MKTAYLALAICLAWQTVEAKKMRIAVASQNPVKIEAVHEAFADAFAEDEIEIAGISASSGIPEQPVGEEMAVRGAMTRMSQLKDLNANYEVSVENYIYQDEGWRDRAVILVKSRDSGFGQTVYTQDTLAPEEHVKAALDEGVTVGEAIHRAREEVDPADWHGYYGNGSRKHFITSALFKALHSEQIAALKSRIAHYSDFPRKGIQFQDFSPILRDSEAFQLCIDLLDKRYAGKGIEAVAGLESRGFIIGAALAYKLGVPFVPVRKAGKIPGAVYTVDYEKEYGSDSFSISKEALCQGQRVLIVDDLIATGGSALAAVELVRLTGAKPVEFLSLLEIKALSGMERIGIPSFNLID